MLAGALFASILTSSPALGAGQQAHPIGDSMRRAADETAKFYGRQWQMEGETLQVALVEPGEWLRFAFSTKKETVSWVFAGQNNGSKLEMNVVDAATTKIEEKAEADSKGSIYFMPKKGKQYFVEVLNAGQKNDIVSVVQVTGGLGAQLPLSTIKFLASSQGHAIWDMVNSGEVSLPVNKPFLKAGVVPPKGTLSSLISLTAPKSTVIAYGDEPTDPIKAKIVDPAGKTLASLVDDGSRARFAEFSKPVPKARITMTNPTNKRLVFSWATLNRN